MLRRFLQTDTSKTLFAQRALLGAVMLPHGGRLLAALQSKQSAENSRRGFINHAT